MLPQVASTSNDIFAPDGRDSVVAEIARLYKPATGNIPILATGHQSKGLEWNTVAILEPSSMMLTKIVDRGGAAAEDEANLKHVMVSRARDRLVYLQDCFYDKKSPGVSALFIAES
jgi:superfamily I DNA/RNA helicase